MFRLDLFGYVIEMKSLKCWILQIRYRTKRKYLPVSYWLQLTKSGSFSFCLLMSAFRGEFYFDTCLMYALDPGSLACLVRSGSSMEGAEGCGRLPEFWDSLATLFNKLPPPPRPRVGTFFGGEINLNSTWHSMMHIVCCTKPTYLYRSWLAYYE